MITSALSSAALRIRHDLRVGRGDPEPAIPQQRADWDRLAGAEMLPAGVVVEPVDAAGVPCEWVLPPGVVDEGAIVLLHGGGYVVGSCVTHRSMAARLAGLTRLPVLVVGYRLAPEHPFPAALDDAVTAFTWLASRVDPARIVVSGDSAGGGLAAALLIRLRDGNEPLPAGAALLSPWLDLEVSGPNVAAMAPEDPCITVADLQNCGRLYRGNTPADHPLVSPIHADPTGLPPLFISAGSLEVLLDDATGFAGRAIEAGVSTTLDIGEGLWHVYPAWAADVPEAAAALERIAAWMVRQSTGRPA